MTTTETRRYLAWFDDIGTDDRLLAGGKGANLGELTQAGLPMPPGFVVTTAAYRALVDDREIRETIERLDSLGPTEDDARRVTAAELRNLIHDQDIDETLTESLTDALSEISDGEKTDITYSVRSSATAEDLPTASFAGQHETFLGVSKDDVLDRVRDCMASLFTDRAVAYRAHNDISNQDVEMAVVVQKMVDAAAAGVLFTADPDTGKRTVASVDATYGLGDLVVAGDVSADNARVDRETGEVLDYEVGEKETGLQLGDEGVETAEMPPERQTARTLTDAQLRTLVELGDTIESQFGEPQDIEWALHDGEFVVLQSRPITSLVALPEPRPDDDRLHVYFSVGHAQAMTDPMPPLALDLWEAVYGGMLNDYTGGDRAWLTRAEGRAYCDITPFLGFSATHDGIVETIGTINEGAAEGAARMLEERRDEFGGDLSLSTLPRVFSKASSMLPVVGRTIPGMIREGVVPFFRGGAGTDEYSRRFHAWGQEQEAKLLDEDDPETLVENAFAGFSDDVVSEMLPKSIRVMIGPVAGGLLEQLVPKADTDLIEAAARGAENEVGTRMTLALDDLADRARESPAVEEAIREERSLDEIREIDGSEPFVEGFEAFLDEFGHRTVSEFDPSRPRWRDDPGAPLGIVRGNLIGQEKGAHRERLRERSEAAAEAIEELQTTAGRGLLGPIRRPLVNHLLDTYRSHIQLRDEPKHGSAHLFAAWHEALQRAGDHLVAEGALTDADDVWFLHHEELLALLEDPGGDLPDIETRREAYERHKQTDVPPLITSEGEIPRAEGEDVGANTLLGTGVSSGITEGTARIVQDPTDANIQSEDILVTPSSDPTWTPLFATARGLVTEVGGRMTHGALVAREYGLPAVVSVKGATEKIADGQRICVDGDQGTVEIIEDDR
jgi:rifampicin phosphotransferase